MNFGLYCFPTNSNYAQGVKKKSFFNWGGVVRLAWKMPPPDEGGETDP